MLSFDETTYNSAKLTVPENNLMSYKNDAVWGLFSSIGVQSLVTSITLDPSEYNGIEGDTFSITATVYPANATNQTLAWSSSDESVASVTQDGVVSILKMGICTITATSTDGSNVEAKCEISSTSDVKEATSEDAETISIYNYSGVMLLQNADPSEVKRLSPGIYIIRQGKTVKKIIVK